ncbi:MAG: DUF3263 domain-containing protein [Acidimicrobiales bacterium]
MAAADRLTLGVRGWSVLDPDVTGWQARSVALTERDRAILEFEGSWWNEPGPKEAAIRSRFGLSASRYRQVLAALAESREAEELDPLVVRRLRRARDQRRRARYGAARPAGGG